MNLSRRNFFAITLGVVGQFVFGSQAKAASKVSIKISKVLTSSITLTVSAASTIKYQIESSVDNKTFSAQTKSKTLLRGKSESVAITNLPSNSNVYLRVRFTSDSDKKVLYSNTINATTLNPTLNSIFAVQADPHMDENSSDAVYRGTLNLIATSGAAFLMDLGDIFMVDKLQDKSEANIRARFELMKNYYNLLLDVPLKITLGNHDGELGYSKFNTKKYRKEYFPEQTGDLAYYAFETVDALHISLDPFTYTTQNPKADGWQWTLGKTQYDWLVQTLSQSDAPHKFVYIHHLLVGDAQSRGGVEIAQFNEWGGKNQDGTDGFAANRPGWAKPIHQLLLEHKVGFVFKGHDHLYVKQELDGIIYQTLPQPSHPGNAVNSSTQYGYKSGKLIGGSGFLKVATTPNEVIVQFIKYDGTVADTYSRTAI